MDGSWKYVLRDFKALQDELGSKGTSPRRLFKYACESY